MGVPFRLVRSCSVLNLGHMTEARFRRAEVAQCLRPPGEAERRRCCCIEVSRQVQLRCLFGDVRSFSLRDRSCMNKGKRGARRAPSHLPTSGGLHLQHPTIINLDQMFERIPTIRYLDYKRIADRTKLFMVCSGSAHGAQKQHLRYSKPSGYRRVLLPNDKSAS